MRTELDDIVRIGAVTIAATAQRSVRGRGSHGVALHGTKRPVAILTRHDDMTRAFEINGRRIAWDEFERRFPGQRAEFERLASDDSSNQASHGEGL
jgi:hypothetical protein